MLVRNEGSEVQIVYLIDGPSRLDLQVEELLHNNMFDFVLREANVDPKIVGIASIIDDRYLVDDSNVSRIKYFTYEGNVKNLFWSTSEGFTKEVNVFEDIFEAFPNVKLVVPTSNMTISSLDERFGRKGILTKYRGSFIRDVRVPYMPTFNCRDIEHTNTLMHQILIEDMYKANLFIQNKIKFIERNLIINPKYKEVLSYLDRMYDEGRNGRTVWFDIEVYNNTMSAISFTTSIDESLCIPFIANKNSHVFTFDEEYEILNRISKIIGSPEIKKGNQNVMFDLSFLKYSLDMDSEGSLEDPMILHSLMYPDLPKDLGFLTSRFTDKEYYKDDGRNYLAPWSDIETFWKYNALDSCVACQVFNEMKETHKEEFVRHEKTYLETLELIPVLVKMENRGIKVDLDALQKIKDQYTIQLKEIEEKIPFNPYSSVQASSYFGVTNVDKFKLVKLTKVKKFAEMAILVQKARRLQKQLSNYLSISIDVDGRFRTSYKIRGTNTGRLASSKTIDGRGFNFQNLSPELLSCLVVDE